MFYHVPLILLGLVAVCGVGMFAWACCRPGPVPIEVLLADWHRRIGVRRQLSSGLRRLRRLLPERGSPAVAILVVEWLPNGQRAHCHVARRRGDSGTASLITVALTSGERRYRADELLAAVAEQYLTLALGNRAPRPASTVGQPPATEPDRLRALLTDLGVSDGVASS